MDLSNYTEQEQQFARWDSTITKQLPWHGAEIPSESQACWTWQWMPTGELYRSYLASNRESRLGIHFVHEENLNQDYWDPVLGGKLPLLRYGSESKLYPEGVQLEMEGAALARLSLGAFRDLLGTDYRFGVPLTWRYHQVEMKLGYYHISSHLGDELMVKEYEKTGKIWRRNYVRDAIMFGVGYHPDTNWRFYLGGDYGFNTACGAEPWQIETGVEYSPLILPSFRGSPFVATHFHWKSENDWNLYFAFELGWQWSTLAQHLCRTGFYLMSGHADQYQYYDRYEKQVGWGLWYDF